MCGGTDEKSDARETNRFDFLSRIEYTLDSPTSLDVHKGVAINISDNGMAVYVFRPYPEGQQIFIKSTLPIEFRAATIRWIKQEDRHFYLTGLHFPDHSAHA
jgi:hypothetical protein